MLDCTYTPVTTDDGEVFNKVKINDGQNTIIGVQNKNGEYTLVTFKGNKIISKIPYVPFNQMVLNSPATS